LAVKQQENVLHNRIEVDVSFVEPLHILSKLAEQEFLARRAPDAHSSSSVIFISARICFGKQSSLKTFALVTGARRKHDSQVTGCTEPVCGSQDQG